MERIRLQMLGKGALDTDAENLDVQGLELAVVDLPGREVRPSDREITTKEFNEYQLLPRRTGEREVRRLLPDLKGWGRTRAHQDASQQHAYQQRTNGPMDQWTNSVKLQLLMDYG